MHKNVIILSGCLQECWISCIGLHNLDCLHSILSLCSTFFSAVSSYCRCFNISLYPWGPHKCPLTFTAQWRNTTCDRVKTEHDKVRCCYTAAAQSSIWPSADSSITSRQGLLLPVNLPQIMRVWPHFVLFYFIKDQYRYSYDDLILVHKPAGKTL